MVNRYVIARDHKTNLNKAREYLGLSEGGMPEWVWASMEATRYTKREAASEVKRLKNLFSHNHEIFFYKD